MVKRRGEIYMRNLDYLVMKAGSHNLVAEYVNDNTLKVYSPKFFFDSWLIKEENNRFELYHQNRKQGSAHKCAYHLHAVVSKDKKIHLLQKIKRHNEYVAYHKSFNKINLVDRVLGKVS